MGNTSPQRARSRISAHSRAHTRAHTVHIHTCAAFIIGGGTRGISMNALNFPCGCDMRPRHRLTTSVLAFSCVTRCECPFGSAIPIAISDLTVSITSRWSHFRDTDGGYHRLHFVRNGESCDLFPYVKSPIPPDARARTRDHATFT